MLSTANTAYRTSEQRIQALECKEELDRSREFKTATQYDQVVEQAKYGNWKDAAIIADAAGFFASDLIARHISRRDEYSPEYGLETFEIGAEIAKLVELMDDVRGMRDFQECWKDCNRTVEEVRKECVGS